MKKGTQRFLVQTAISTVAVGLLAVANVIVGSGYSYLECDYSDGCRNKTEHVYGENDGQKNVRQVAQQKGWQCRTDGKDYCPEHTSWKLFAPKN